MSIAPALMAAQQAQSEMQMIESHAMSAANSAKEHQQRLLGQHHESERAIQNDQIKRSDEAQTDSAALLKDSTQKLDSSASA